MQFNPKSGFNGPDGKRLRFNWLNVGLAIILMIATASAMNLRDHHPNLYTGWSLFGLMLAVAGGVVVVVLLLFARAQNRTWAVFAAFGMGVAIALVLEWLISSNDISAKELFSGVVTFAVIVGCLVGIGITRWRRPSSK